MSRQQGIKSDGVFEPLITCAVVTQESRLQVLPRALECFRKQTYSRRELLIVFDGPTEFAQRMEILAGATGARAVNCGSGRNTLGRLRNTCIEEARGELICQWDDDDIFHPLRLEVQLAALHESGADACYLADQLYLFEQTGELFYRRSPWIHGTPLFRRSVSCTYPEKGAAARRGEDQVFFRRLRHRHSITRVTGQGWLYVRVHHGQNTWDEPHHRRLARHGLSVEELRKVEAQLGKRIREIGLRQVTLCGNDGPAFSIAL
jgi:glycosyltransferase involved in cell wall biosynthesis